MHFIPTLPTRETSWVIPPDPGALVLHSPSGCKLTPESFFCVSVDSLYILFVSKNLSFVFLRGRSSKQGGKNKFDQFFKCSLIRIKPTEQINCKKFSLRKFLKLSRLLLTETFHLFVLHLKEKEV